MNKLTEDQRAAIAHDYELTVQEIDQMSPNELFEHVIDYEGLIDYAHSIKAIVWALYGVDLNEINHQIVTGSGAEA